MSHFSAFQASFLPGLNRNLLRTFGTLLLLFMISACEEAKPKTDTLSKLQFKTVAGETVSMSQYLDKIVVLNVWATWCAPCLIEMPDLESLKQSLNPDQVVILGVSIDKNPHKVDRFLQENSLTFTSYLDPGKNLRNLFWESGIYRQPLFSTVAATSIIPLSGRENGATKGLLKPCINSIRV